MSDDKRMISTSILTATADAIRAKDGSAEPIKPSEFAEKITAIPSGGGGGTATITYTRYKTSNTDSGTVTKQTYSITSNNLKIAVKNVYRLDNDGLSLLSNGSYSLYGPESDIEIGIINIQEIDGIRYLILKKWVPNYTQYHLEPNSTNSNMLAIDVDWEHVNVCIQNSSKYILFGLEDESSIVSTSVKIKGLYGSTQNTLTGPASGKTHTVSALILPLNIYTLTSGAAGYTIGLPMGWGLLS